MLCTHLDRYEKDLGDEGHHVRVVVTALEGLLAHKYLKNGEKMIHELNQVLSLGPNR